MKSGIPELRLLRFKSYTERYVKRFGEYDVLNHPGRLPAAITHLAAGGFLLDPLLSDAAASLEGNKRPVPRLEGMFPRVREDTVGAMRNVLHGEFLTAAARVANIIGDTVADTADVLFDMAA